jgi:Tetratricopeptide repeat
MDLETAGWHASPDSSHSAARAIGIIRRPTRTSGSTFTVPVSVQSWLVGKEEGEAIALYERTLAAQGRVLGADHPDTLISRNDLAGAYEQAGGRTKRLTFCSAAQVRKLQHRRSRRLVPAWPRSRWLPTVRRKGPLRGRPRLATG